LIESGVNFLDKSPSIKKSKKIARERPPIDPKMIDFHFPPVALRKLSNGLKLLVVERHDLPKIYFRVGLQYGKKYDRPEQAGLSELLSATLKKGTRLRDYESIVETIDAAGGELETAISEDFFFAFGDFLKEYFQVGLEILSEILRQPSFPEMEFRKEQMKLLANLENEKSSPPYLAHRQMNQLIYRPHPYYLHKTKDSIQAISQSDLAGIHRQYFNPEQMLVVVAGDVDEQEAVDGIEKHFSDWPAAARSEILFEIPRYLNSRQIHLVDRPGSAQVNILLGNPLFPRRHPDYEKMLVMNKILGGGGSGRLFFYIREEKG
jgi:zinc protease